MRAVANSGPLIHLSWIDRLDILGELFEEVLVPPAVRQGVLSAAPHVPGVTGLRVAFAAGRLKLQPVGDQGLVITLTTDLDRGESEAIALMNETGADVLLLDDRRARATAHDRGFPFTGTIGILKLARGRGLISSVVPMLHELRRRGFWISAELMEEIGREETYGSETDRSPSPHP